MEFAVERPYLVLFKLGPTHDGHAKVIKQLQQYSTTRPMRLCNGKDEIAYLITTALPMKEMTFDGSIRSDDAVVIAELGGHATVEGYPLREIGEWMRRHLRPR